MKVKFLRDKRKSRKDAPFNQCTKISYNILCEYCFTFFTSGSSKGAVAKAINTSVRLNLCLNGIRVKFFSIGWLYTPHVSSIGKANRASNKQEWFKKLKYRFYSVDSDYKNYEALLKYGCRNIFETVESWRMALIHFDAKVKLNLCDKKNLKFFLSSSELKQEACNLVLSYFCLVSKSMRECQKKHTAEQITAGRSLPLIT